MVESNIEDEIKSDDDISSEKSYGKSDESEENMEISLDSGIDMAEFNSNDKVEEVLSTIEGDDSDDYDLVFEGQVLPRKKTLGELGITKNTKKIVKVEKKIEMNILNAQGKTTSLNLRPSDTVRSLRQQYFGYNGERDFGDPMTFNGKVLQDSQLLRQSNIRNGCTIHMGAKLVGG